MGGNHRNLCSAVCRERNDGEKKSKFISSYNESSEKTSDGLEDETICYPAVHTQGTRHILD